MHKNTSSNTQSDLDYYQLLGLTPSATTEQIRKAYKSLARKHHPDRSGGSHESFINLKRAYDTLVNPERREIYDLGARQGIDYKDFQRVLQRALNEIVVTALAKIDVAGGIGNLAQAFRREIKSEQRTVSEKLKIGKSKIKMLEKQLASVKKGKESRLVSMVLLKKEEIERTLQSFEVDLAVLKFLEKDAEQIEVDEMRSVKIEGVFTMENFEELIARHSGRGSFS